MKINPIQNYGYTNYYKPIQKSTRQTEPNNLPIADNYGRAMVFKSNISQNIVNNISFEDKLAVGLSKLTSEGFLVAAKDVAEAKKALKNVLKDFPGFVKEVLFVKDSSLKSPFIVSRIDDNAFLLHNVGEIPIIHEILDAILPQEVYPIREGESVRFINGWTQFKQEPENEIDSKLSSSFLKQVDCTKEAEKLTKVQINNILSKLEKGNETQKKTLSFADIGGQDEVINILKKEFLYPLKYPEVFEDFMLSRGAILYGPPGTGKTLLAKALVAESGASAFELCGTDMASKYVGESEQNCRELFQKAVDAQPSIIFFDEIDALGKSRGEDVHGDKLLTQLLSLVSDIEKRGDNVFILGSTNRMEDLDPALTRSGRFSTLLEVKAPDLAGTRQILEIHTKGKPLEEGLNLDEVAKSMFAKKMTGADISATVKNAYSNTLERLGIYKSMESGRFSSGMKDFIKISQEDFDKAINSFNQAKKDRKPIGFNK